MNTDMILYYKDRAKEYEKIYYKPERQNDLTEVKKILQQIFFKKEVLEIACGTGYWTEIIAATAKEILATDINETVIEIARSKSYQTQKINFAAADIFQLKNDIKHESLFAGFIWSHIKLQEVEKFIATVNNLVRKNGTIVFIDNNYVEESSTPISETDDAGNTYQTRKLENGTEHKVLKNFPQKKFIKQILKNKAANVEIINLKYFWILNYKIV